MATMGQTIKKLRKERSLTQEELAEQLNVTFQAVSKWENDTGMPDISQIVPLASVFGVSTDVLFGTVGTSDNEEAAKIIKAAYSLNDDGAKPKKCVWDELQNGLRLYPNNIMLLMVSLQYGCALAYPENDCYDETCGDEIYRECIRQANIVTSYGKSITDVLRAHMIMVLLHSSYGDSAKAREHAQNFPVRADMTINAMEAYIAHSEKDFVREGAYHQRGISYLLPALLDEMILLGKTYANTGNHGDALRLYSSVFPLMELVFGEDELMPPVQNTDSGDVYVLTAQAYSALGDRDKALEWLEKMVDYDISVRSRFTDRTRTQSAFLRGINGELPYLYASVNVKERLLLKFQSAELAELRDDTRFSTLLRRAEEM
jgi:Predicted transcriptional regulators